jgi:D-serine deaminase-like pyridoxal phosphate-dependent protein
MPEVLNVRSVLREIHDRVRRAYGGAIGARREEVVTPALILDLPAARRNIDKAAERLRGMSADLRPHIKVHKSPQLARMQLDAGAIGLSVATIWEAITMAHEGAPGVFIANTVAGREKLAAVAALASAAEVMIAVDDAANGEAISRAARDAGANIGLMIEVDSGMDRAGVDTIKEAVALAERVADLPGVTLMGVTGYEGHCSLIPEHGLRHQRQQTAMAFLVETAGAIRARGLPAPIVSAGGTATWEWTATYPGVTEIQAGSYTLMDNFHGAMVGGFEIALTVLATVISRRPDRVIVDVGSKSIGAPALASIKGHDLANFRFDEEHGVFAATPADGLAVGEVVELIPGYAPGTVNWYDAYHVIEDDQVIDIWPVIPRGPGHGGLLGSTRPRNGASAG